ncbi:LPXTG cell wall anchor domain-containing protein [Listeria ilorinensis]|uniref:LPXTG cell wall anchor domain-containing protein n=1 Tax=Listeria ilorinensis TaxID=2867439 RepID=UPI001EF43D07|nr:LPXTG cell wall anchor domain-containing protein [Listeria ilorinensis]
MKKKRFGFILLICVILFSQWPAYQTKAAEFGSQFLDSVELLDENDQPKDEFGYYDNIQVHYQFSIPNDENVMAGDTMTIQLPEQLKLSGNVTFNVLDSEQNVVGQAQANRDTNQLTVTFSDYMETHENVHGDLYVWTEWNQSIIHGNETVDLNFPLDKGMTVVPVIIDEEPQISPDEKLAKWGSVDVDDPTLIYWTVRVNFEGSPIDNAVYEDMIGADQELIPESIKVQLGTYDPDGTWHGGVYLPSSDITLTDTGFKVAFGTLTGSAKIDYRTRATDGGASSQYYNSGILTGENIVNKQTAVYTPYSGGGGSGTGDQYANVELTKVDAADHETVLSGAEFELQNQAGETIQTGLVTDENGKITIEKLPLGTYQLVEVAAPEGYQLDTTPLAFTLKAGDVGKMVYLQKENTKEVPKLGQVELRKYDKDDSSKTLPGAEFQLVDGTGNVLQEGILTDETGYLYLDQLPFGDYALIETKAPEGYLLDNEPVCFTIDEENYQTVQLVEKANERVPESPVVPDEPIIPNEPVTPETPVSFQTDDFTTFITTSEKVSRTPAILPKTGDRESDKWPFFLGSSMLLVGWWLFKRR